MLILLRWRDIVSSIEKNVAYTSCYINIIVVDFKFNVLTAKQQYKKEVYIMNITLQC